VSWLRATVIGTSISLLVSLVVITPGSAAVKAGGECKKVGLKTQFKGNSFICIQSGNKKIWKVAKKEKPVALPTVLPTSTLKPTSTPTPSQSLTPTQTPTPTPSPTFPREPKNFSDITDYDQVTYWAWRKSSDKIKSSESIVKEVEVLIGPKSGILNKNPLEATQITSRLYGGFAQPKDLKFISYSFEDIPWAQNLINTLINDEVLLNLIQAPNRGGKENARGTCPSIERCHSSQPFTNRAGKSFVIAGYTPSRLDNEGETKGELQSHEFTHIVQQHQFISTARELNGLAGLKEFLPWWLVEGGADFGGLLSKHYLSYEEYLQGRLRDVLRVPKREKSWYEDFINPASNQYWIQYDSTGEIYNIGFMVTEIMSALKGPGVQMELIKLIASGKSMDQAFESIFDTPWKSAVSEMAILIAKERART
jgi:hypothetical protein